MRLRHWLAQGPFTLTLSSGFFGFYAHTGMLYALIEAGFVPARASGSSAGALVAGAWAAGVEPAELDARLRRLARSEFWDPGWGPGLLRGALFRALLEELLPVRTFAECRVPLRLSVFDLNALCTRSIDSGELAPAIAASCTVPLMFQPVRADGRWLIDGGMLDRPGLLGVPPDARVLYHHLPSRVPGARLRSALGRVPPRRNGLVAVTLVGLPRADPFHLEAGKTALERARRDMHRALERPIEQARVCV
jgi:NTE family protein